MRQKPGTKQSHGEKVAKDIRRVVRHQAGRRGLCNLVCNQLCNQALSPTERIGLDA